MFSARGMNSSSARGSPTSECAHAHILLIRLPLRPQQATEELLVRQMFLLGTLDLGIDELGDSFEAETLQELREVILHCWAPRRPAA